MSLDLYAAIEPLIGFDEEVTVLYETYIDLLHKYDRHNVLDIGCGNGSFMQRVLEEDMTIEGVDLSHSMITIAKEKGLNAHVTDVCDVTQTYDSAVAIFDVLNYIPEDELTNFLTCVSNRIEKGGYFFADINTKHGFEDIAQGTLHQENETKNLIVDAFFENNQLHTTMTLFSRIDQHYTKEQSSITQFFHPIRAFSNHPSLKVIKKTPLKLFSDQADKTILIFQKQ
jgi:cyclopropane fatty-acyl-phospholipid synthase-like methyltransferase